MRLQHVAVMFVIIFIPIILVTSYFISLQVNTVKLEASYTEKLLNATYDAMTAFELNTANEDLSSVSDSLRSIIEASNNIFFNTLCTNLGVSNASKSFVQPYIPAVLYTLYDGYYIYSPTNIPEICVDDFGRTIRTSDYGVTLKTTINGIGIYEFDKTKIVYSEFNPAEPAEDELQTTSRLKYEEIGEEYSQILYKNKDGITYSTELHTWTDANAKYSTYYKRDYILKSYIPYSANYSDGSNIDVTINYTLDNFMTIEGNIGEIYYTKSGYFIDEDLVEEIIVDGTPIAHGGKDKITGEWTTPGYSEEILDEYIYNPENHKVIVELSNGITISNRDGVINVSVTAEDGTSSSRNEYWDDAQSAVEYYVDSYIFSGWVYEKLGGIQAGNLKNNQYSVFDIQKNIQKNIDSEQTKLYDEMFYKFSGDTTLPFSIDGNNPEDSESAFCTHKRNVIKNSITYNLVLSMIVYTEESKTIEYSMPVFDETEWDRILNNVSITTFMEGMRCGLKYYNNYAIVTSTNNEIMVTDNEIYYVPRAYKNESGNYILNSIEQIQEDDSNSQTAHRIDCEDLVLNETGAISFKSKEIKYDKILNKDGSYTYDHMAYTDYNCIVDSNYTVTDKNGKKLDGNTDILGYLTANSNVSGTNLQQNLYWKLRAYRIAIAKERNNLYKTTAFAENYGTWTKILDNSHGNYVFIGSHSGQGGGDLILKDTRMSDLKKVEIIAKNQKDDKTAGMKIVFKNGSENYSSSEIFIPQGVTDRTYEYIIDTDKYFNMGINRIVQINRVSGEFRVKAIKYYYK